jgi:Secretion system C-terminal sorting domain
MNALVSVYFTDAQNGWIVGDFGTILHTSTGGVTPINKTLVPSPTFSLYPNPAEEYVTLQTHSPIQSIVITDALGRSVGAQNFVPLPGNRLNISSLAPGLYTIKIQTDEGTAMQRVVKR